MLAMLLMSVPAYADRKKKANSGENWRKEMHDFKVIFSMKA